MTRALAIVAVCATSAYAHTGVLPGEAYTYRFAVGPIEGARARMSVGLPVMRDGHALVAVQGEAETISIAKLLAPISGSYVLTLDAATILPREVTSTERGLRDRAFHATFSGKHLSLEVQTAQKHATTEHELSREARDPLSAYFALRAQPLTAGEHIELDVLDGAILWRCRLTVAGVEEITLGENTEHPRPPARAIRLDGDLARIFESGHPVPRPHRTISLWLSDDAARVLYRAQFDSELGRALLELTSYTPPTKRSGVLPVQSITPGLTISESKQ